MTALRVLRSRIRGLFTGRDRDDDLRQEVEAHIDLLTEEHVRRGLTRDEARAAARRAFGGVDQMTEAYRDQRALPFVDALMQDVRFAARLFMKDRGFTAAAVIALALGIGANATVFTIVNAAVFRDLPFDAPDRIVALGTRNVRSRSAGGPQGYNGVSYAEYHDWRDAVRLFAGIAAYRGATMNVSDEEHAPERVAGTFVSAHTFDLIGARPLAGRGFLPADDRPGAPPVIVLGHDVWRSRYGADPAVIGRTIRVNGVPAAVIGVMPAGFQFPLTSGAWQPLALLPGVLTQARDNRALDLVGRLADQVTIAQARAELDAITGRLAQAHPQTNKDIQPAVVPYVERHIAPQVNFIFYALLGAVSFVLLIACANVANLLLARAMQRSREIAIRASLGATRSRIVRQLLIESVLLATVAGLLGFLLSLGGLRAFSLLLESFGPRPYWIRFTLDTTVFAYLALVCLGTAVLFGLAPALHISKTNARKSLESGRSGTPGVGARRWTSALVVGELAMALVLLAGGGFFVRSFLDAYRLDTGVDTAGLVRVRLDLPQARYPTPEHRAALFGALETRVNALPGVVAAVTSALPLGGGPSRELTIAGREPRDGERLPTVTVLTVGPRYFDTLGVRLLRGRPFADTDGGTGREGAIVNQHFVSTYFPDADPIGSRIRLAAPGPSTVPPPWVTIVGVSPTVRQWTATDPDHEEAVAYLPWRTPQQGGATLLVRAAEGLDALAPRLREEVRALDPDLPLFDVTTLDQWLAFLRSPQRVFGTVFATFAVIALALAAVGLYAVTAHAVTLRTREIGVRMALGAQVSQVWWLIVKRGLLQLCAGLTIGLAGAYGVGNLLNGQWATGNDPTTLVAIAALLACVSLAACIWPARRATRLDPVAALRHE